MNERIILHFVEFSPNRSVAMVRLAREFASSKPDGRPGMRHGTVYGFGEWSAIAYWTARRTVVVRELEPTGRVTPRVTAPGPKRRDTS